MVVRVGEPTFQIQSGLESRAPIDTDVCSDDPQQTIGTAPDHSSRVRRFTPTARCGLPGYHLLTQSQGFQLLFRRSPPPTMACLPGYTQIHLPHALRISLGQFRVSSHRLRIESGRAKGIPREGRTCLLCDLQEIELEEHFALRCPTYYAIQGRYHCLFRDRLSSLSRMLQFLD